MGINKSDTFLLFVFVESLDLFIMFASIFVRLYFKIAVKQKLPIASNAVGSKGINKSDTFNFQTQSGVRE